MLQGKTAACVGKNLPIASLHPNNLKSGHRMTTHPLSLLAKGFLNHTMFQISPHIKNKTVAAPTNQVLLNLLRRKNAQCQELIHLETLLFHNPLKNTTQLKKQLAKGLLLCTKLLLCNCLPSPYRSLPNDLSTTFPA